MDLFDKIKELIEERELLRPGDGVIVGFSGGPDSLCLLHLLLRLAEPLQLTIRAVHLNHGFRGEAARADAQFAAEFCRINGIECAVYDEDVAEQARRQGISEETAGRNARYRCFFAEKETLERELKRAMAERLIGSSLEHGNRSGSGNRSGHEDSQTCTHGQVRIAVAHNRNDQAETILMRIMRGTGLTGLRGMELSRPDGVIRPLLFTSREEIEEYCRRWELHPRMDHTNQEADYTRNRIRLELLPYMETHFNENVVDALCRLGEIAGEGQDVILGEVQRQKELLIRQGGDGLLPNCCQPSCQSDQTRRTRQSDQGSAATRCFEAERRKVASLPDGLRHGLSLEVLRDLGLSQNVKAIHMRQIDQLLNSDAASGETDLPQGFRVEISYDIVRWQAPEVTGAKLKMEESETMQADTITRRAHACQIAVAAANGGDGYLQIRETSWEEMKSLQHLKELPVNQRCFDGGKLQAALGCAIKFPAQTTPSVTERTTPAAQTAQTTPAAQITPSVTAQTTSGAATTPSATVQPTPATPGAAQITPAAQTAQTTPGATATPAAPGVTQPGLVMGGLELRSRRPGDFIRPLGAPGRKKLQDYFVDRKIPQKLRERIPLVCIGSEVLWVVGHQVSENYKVEEGSERLIFIEFHGEMW